MESCGKLFVGVALAVGAGSAAIDIDEGRQLFVDDWLVDSTQGIVRVYNHPTKAFDAPVMWPETDLEREVDPKRPYRFAPVAGATSGGLWWDPVKKVFRLWYEAGWMKYLCYAESKDGITWERNDLGIVKGTNRVLADTLLDSWSVIPDYAAADPYANWRLMVSVAGGVTDNRLYTSADGIAWTHIGNAGQSGDRSTMFYDPFRGKWVFSLRGGGPTKGGRNRSYWASETFGGETCLWNFPAGRFSKGLHPDLPRPKPWLATDEKDVPDPSVGGLQPQLYNMDAVAYESIMISLFEILHPFKGDNGTCASAGLPKITDLHFAYSRDGWNFNRPDRTAAIAASRWGSGKWDTGYLSPMGGICVIKDERLWFYYTAMRGDATETTPHSRDPEIGWRRNGMHFNASIGVATLRRDGFVGLVADGRGEVTTKPVTFSGKHLFVNAEYRFGSLAAEVLDEKGDVLPGFAATDCLPLVRTDSTKSEIRWKGGDLAALAGKAVRFRFKLHCGTFYSFWVSRDPSGKSGGYLAAGGPAYKGIRDL
ncbi:MAG: glycosyl hydrolase family 32 [Kiritimatiellae bacterium]|nr:glycosyl hydrolase family 32 [Kiritimatiellia bacterium]